MKYQVIQGDNREVLKQYPDNHFDSIITDPPYGIDFLGKSWDANTGALETYQECLRVLKPGGHILAFSAARTYHHIAVTLEQAGFEIRDQIMWIYSSGFPKSQDVGKSIDRQSGKASHKAELAEVKAILKHLYKDSGKSNTQIDRECGFNAGAYLKTDFKDKGWANNLPKDDKWLKLKSVLGCGDEYDDYFLTTPQIKIGEKEAGCFDQEFENYTIGARSKMVDITASQTEAGRQWAGWGTALKPAHEPICMARKPSKLSTAKNVQKWGVGALNIDATRIPYESEADKNSIDHKVPTAAWSGHTQQVGSYEQGQFVKVETNDQGRFPSNVIGEITDYQKYFYCPKVSRKERHAGFDLKKVPIIEHNDPETIHLHPLWTPAIGKNVYRLKEAIEKHNNEVPEPMFGDVQGCYGPDGERFAVGLDQREVVNETDKLKQMGGYFLDENNQKTNKSSKNIWLPHTGPIYAHGLNEEYRKWCKVNGKTPNVGNNHPTVKPVELMKYLIKLVTPKGGIVLDPFNGSGSTGMAAVELGHEYMGIELDVKYCEISERRIAAHFKKSDPLRASGLFDE